MTTDSLFSAVRKTVRFTTFADGLKIEKDTGTDQYFLGTGDLELVGSILNAVLGCAAPVDVNCQQCSLLHSRLTAGLVTSAVARYSYRPAERWEVK